MELGWCWRKVSHNGPEMRQEEHLGVFPVHAIRVYSLVELHGDFGDGGHDILDVLGEGLSVSSQDGVVNVEERFF